VARATILAFAIVIAWILGACGTIYTCKVSNMTIDQTGDRVRTVLTCDDDPRAVVMTTEEFEFLRVQDLRCYRDDPPSRGPIEDASN